MNYIDFDEVATPAGWARGVEDEEYAPYLDFIANKDISVGCFTVYDIEQDGYDAEEAVLTTDGWAWWDVKHRTWTPLDTSACTTLEEVCAAALLLTRMS